MKTDFYFPHLSGKGYLGKRTIRLTATPWLWLIAMAAIFSPNQALAQNAVEGTVLDAETRSPVPFVHIAAGGSKRFGGVSNIDGHYRFSVPENTSPETPMTLSCIGYKPLTMPFGKFSIARKVMLVPKAAELREVVVKAKEDPGYAIIRKAVDNRRKNDPETLPGFKVRSYNKAGLDTERSLEIQAELDSTGFRNARFFLMESSTELIYKKPGKWNETVIATKMSGVRAPSLAIISNSFQPFATYGDHINLMETDFLNPVSPGSHHKYVFELTDSAFVDGEKVHIVRFQPRAKVTGHLLTGSVTISSLDYAIVNFRGANTTSLTMIDFEIMQNYGKQDGRWFPKESKALYTMHVESENEDEEDIPLLLYSTTYISDIDIGYEAARKDFNVAEVTLADGAGTIDDNRWAALRPIDVDSIDLNTYAVWDTLPTGLVNGMNWLMEQSASLAAGRIAFGKIDLLLNRVLRLNRYENYRLGAGISTNRNFIRWVSFEGWFGYGFGDHRLKYGGGTVFHLSRRHAFDLAFRYRNDVDEPGRGVFNRDYSFTAQGFTLRNFFTTVMNPVEVYTAEITIRPLRDFKFDAGFDREERLILPGRVFDAPDIEGYSIINTSWRAELDWVPGESLMQVGNVMVPTSFSYPRLRFKAGGGLPNVLDGSQDYFRTDFEFSYAVRLRRAGALQLHGGAGKIWGDGIAFPYLNFGRGIKNEEFLGLEAPGFFQTMGLYDFLTDEYAYAGMSHNFGTVFGIDGKWSKPKLKVSYSAGIGNLRNSNEQRAPVAYKRMQKPYLEAGLVIEEIIRFKLSKSAANYTALGFGGFVLHGHYASPRIEDNMAFVVSIANSF